MGANPEQLHPTVPLQCVPCEATWLWVGTSIATGTSAVVVEANEQRPTMAVAEPATIARVRTSFFIFRYPNPCRAQLLSLLSALNEETHVEVTHYISAYMENVPTKNSMTA